MHFVYVLQSKKTGKLYIGYSSNLKERLEVHNQKRSLATKHGIPWILIYYEAFLSKSDALKRERQLKRFKSAYRFLKQRIKDSIGRA